MAITFDETRGLFKSDKGIYITREAVRAEITRLQAEISKESTRISRLLFKGDMTLVDWQFGMLELVKKGHVMASAIGHGGRSRMTEARWGKVGGKLQYEYRSLNQFARQIEQGRVILEAQMVRRANLYAIGIRASYYAGEIAVAKAAGFTKSQRVLHALETCTECREWNSKGPVPIDSQPAIGQLKCGQFCRCTLEYT